jgi:hypothetical protein
MPKRELLVRLRLASEVYEREITTFNDLSRAELWALHQWIILGNVAPTTSAIGTWNCGRNTAYR